MADSEQDNGVDSGDAAPRAAMLVIGDEILSGRTRDANMPHLAQALLARGIALAEARVVADDPAAIRDAVRALSMAYDDVFTSGGIGPTHDDITADAVAEAMGAAIDVRADARERLEAHYEGTGTELNAARLRMARIPDGARLIDNPVSAAPGFSLGNVHVMAGIPKIFQAMLEGLLPRLRAGPPEVSRSLAVSGGEGDLAGPLGEVARDYPDLAFGSYPVERPGGGSGFEVSLVVRGRDGERVAAALSRLRRELGTAAAEEAGGT